MGTAAVLILTMNRFDTLSTGGNMEYITYGVYRISTAKQNIERQERNILRLYQDAIIIKETYTGTKFDGRKEWNKLYTKMQIFDKNVENYTNISKICAQLTGIQIT